MSAASISVQSVGIGMKQTTFASAAWDRKGKVTRRERFLAEMDAVVPWAQIQAVNRRPDWTPIGVANV